MSGKMIVISDIQGCQDKTNSQYLTKLVCKPQFFISLHKFMETDNNKLAFVGNYFDKGSYVISTIMNIHNLMATYGERVHLVLSFREINKMRFIFELDKVLLRQGIPFFPGYENLEIEKVFVPQEHVTSSDLENDDDAQKYLNSVCGRIYDIMTQTHDGRKSYCVLIHDSMKFAFKNARRQGYLELVLKLQQLGSLLLVYPFLVDSDTIGTLLSKREVKFMIQYLVRTIKEYFEEMCTYQIPKNIRVPDSQDEKEPTRKKRDDALYKDLKKHLERIYGVVEEEDSEKDYVTSGKIPPLDVWARTCDEFFRSGSIMKLDRQSSTLFMHDYSLIDYFRVFKISYSLIMTGLSVDSIYEMEGKTDSFDRSFALYYEKLYFFYKMYDFCYRELEELNFDEFTDEDKLALKDRVEKEKIRVLLELCGQDKKKRRDVFLNFSQSLDGEEAENHKLHTFKKNIKECKALQELSKPKIVSKKGRNVNNNSNKTKRNTPGNNVNNEAGNATVGNTNANAVNANTTLQPKNNKPKAGNVDVEAEKAGISGNVGAEAEKAGIAGNVSANATLRPKNNKPQAQNVGAEAEKASAEAEKASTEAEKDSSQPENSGVEAKKAASQPENSGIGGKNAPASANNAPGTAGNQSSTTPDENPAANNPANVNVPAANNPTIENPAAENPAANNPAANNPAANNPAAENPAANNPTIENPAANVNVPAENPADENPADENPAVENPTTGNPVLKGGSNDPGAGFGFMSTYVNEDITKMNFKEMEDMGQAFSLENFVMQINNTVANLISWRPESKDPGMLETFLFLQAFYLRINNNPTSFLVENVLERDEKFLKFVHSQVKFIVCGNVDSGLAFPCVFKHTVGRNAENMGYVFVAPNISKHISERMFTSLDSIVELDDDELNKYTLFRQRNYPLAIIDSEGGEHVEIASLTKSGKISKKHTYIGEYMGHTFLQYYSTHHFMRKGPLSFSTTTDVNKYLEARKMTANLLPSFSPDYNPDTESSLFTGSCLFIQIDDKLKNNFLILFFKYRDSLKEPSQVFYYLGDIYSWNGFFYDPYLRKLKIMLLTNTELSILNGYLGLKGMTEVYPPTKESQVDASSGLILTREPEEEQEEEEKKEEDEQNANNESEETEKPKEKPKKRKKTKTKKPKTPGNNANN